MSIVDHVQDWITGTGSGGLDQGAGSGSSNPI